MENISGYKLYTRDDETFDLAIRLLGDNKTTTVNRALRFWRSILETKAIGGYYGFVDPKTSRLKKLDRFQRSFNTHKKLSPNRLHVNLRGKNQEVFEQVIILGNDNKREAICRALDAWRDILEAREANIGIIYKANVRAEPTTAIFVSLL